MRISSGDTVVPSVSCSRHNLLMSSRGASLVILPSFLKAFGEDRLDAMDSRGDGTCRKSGDLADRGGVDILEIEQHDLRVRRLDRPVHVRQPRQRLLLGVPAPWVAA